MKKFAVISLSGGMDSSTLLLNLLREGYTVQAVSFHYGQKHEVELERAEALVDYLRDNEQDVAHQIIEIGGLGPLLNSNLVQGGDDVPEGHYEDENMKATVVPNRNKIFSSLIQAVALSISTKEDAPVKIAMGIHAGDHAVYPDCRQEFRDADHEAFMQGNWGAAKVTFYTPYLNIDKEGILLDGEDACKELGLSFDEVYSRTMTSYKPIKIKNQWYADYKSASSVERVEAFLAIGRPDPCAYADESGPVIWETVATAVSKVLANAK